MPVARESEAARTRRPAAGWYAWNWLWRLRRAYWYALYPFHQLVFSGMVRGIARAAERA